MLRSARGSVRLTGRARRRRDQAADPGRAVLDLALRRLPAGRASAVGARRRLDAADPRRSARRGARDRRALDQERRGQPDALVQGSRRLGRARACPGARLHDDRLRVDRATSRTPSPLTPLRPGSSPTCSSRPTWRSRRCSRPGSTGRTWLSVKGNYDDVNRLCTELAGEHDWAFVNINMRPYYAEGSKTLAFEIAEQLGFELPDRVVAPIASGSLFTKLARGFEEWLEVGLIEGRGADLQRCPGRGLLAGRDRVQRGPRLLPAGQARHDREVAGDRQPGRRSATRSSSRGAAAARSTRSPTTRSATGSSCSRRPRASSPRPPAASRSRCCASSPSAATSTAPSGWSR